MSDPVITALARGGMVEVSTIGRHSGNPHRIRVGLHSIDRTLYISGQPGKRDWYANLQANPSLTIHFTRGATADVPAAAEFVPDRTVRKTLIEKVMISGHGMSPDRAAREFDRWMSQSPLVIVHATWPGWV